jgi:gluconate 2-dehydrogenase gamma chain
VLESGVAQAALVKGGLPFRPGGTNPPDGASPGAWQFFTPEEGMTVEAIVDRLIPADALSPGGKDVGCAVYIDRQLAGPYGHFGGYYMKGPFQRGTPQQGEQSDVTFAERYRKALATLDDHCRQAFGMRFADLSNDREDQVIKDLEDDRLRARRGQRERLLQTDSQRHPAGVLRRSDLRRQQGHGVVEDDRLSRHALRLSRMGGTA